jgi:hypothetical protein
MSDIKAVLTDMQEHAENGPFDDGMISVSTERLKRWCAVLAAATPGQAEAVRDATLEEAYQAAFKAWTCSPDVGSTGNEIINALQALKSASVSEQKGE